MYVTQTLLKGVSAAVFRFLTFLRFAVFVHFCVRFFGFWFKIYRFFGFRISFDLQIKKVASFLILRSFCLKWNACFERTLITTKYRTLPPMHYHPWLGKKSIWRHDQKGNSSSCLFHSKCQGYDLCLPLFGWNCFPAYLIVISTSKFYLNMVVLYSFKFRHKWCFAGAFLENSPKLTVSSITSNQPNYSQILNLTDLNSLKSVDFQ